LALGDVTQEGRELASPARAYGRDGDLDWELRAVRPQCRYLRPLVQHRALAGGEIVGKAVKVRLAPGRRHEHVGHVLVQHLLAWIAKRLLRGCVELDDASVLIDADDAVRHPLENGPLAGFALVNGLFGPIALDELANLL